MFPSENPIDPSSRVTLSKDERFMVYWTRPVSTISKVRSTVLQTDFCILITNIPYDYRTFDFPPHTSPYSSHSKTRTRSSTISSLRGYEGRTKKKKSKYEKKKIPAGVEGMVEKYWHATRTPAPRSWSVARDLNAAINADDWRPIGYSTIPNAIFIADFQMASRLVFNEYTLWLTAIVLPHKLHCTCRLSYVYLCAFNFLYPRIHWEGSHIRFFRGISKLNSVTLEGV